MSVAFAFFLGSLVLVSWTLTEKGRRDVGSRQAFSKECARACQTPRQRIQEKEKQKTENKKQKEAEKMDKPFRPEKIVSRFFGFDSPSSPSSYSCLCFSFEEKGNDMNENETKN